VEDRKAEAYCPIIAQTDAGWNDSAFPKSHFCMFFRQKNGLRQESLHNLAGQA